MEEEGDETIEQVDAPTPTLPTLLRRMETVDEVVWDDDTKGDKALEEEGMSVLWWWKSSSTPP